MKVNDIELELKFNTALKVPKTFEVLDLYGKPYREVDLYDFSMGYDVQIKKGFYASIPWDADISIANHEGHKVLKMCGNVGPHGYGLSTSEIPLERLNDNIKFIIKAQPMYLLRFLNSSLSCNSDEVSTVDELHEFANEIEFDYSMGWLFKTLMACKVQFVNNSNK